MTNSQICSMSRLWLALGIIYPHVCTSQLDNLQFESISIVLPSPWEIFWIGESGLGGHPRASFHRTLGKSHSGRAMAERFGFHTRQRWQKMVRWDSVWRSWHLVDRTANERKIAARSFPRILYRTEARQLRRARKQQHLRVQRTFRLFNS